MKTEVVLKYAFGSVRIWTGNRLMKTEVVLKYTHNSPFANKLSKFNENRSCIEIGME